MKKIRIFALSLLIFLAAFSAVFADADDETRQDLLEALNAVRIRYHVGTVKMDLPLQSAAQHQAEYLASIGKLENSGPSGEPVSELARDAGYGGDKAFTIVQTNAQVWVDTDIDYLIEKVWRGSPQSVRVLFDPGVRQAGIGIADAPDKHRYYVLLMAGLDDGTDDYSMTRPTYDYRTPKPTISATPTQEPLITSTPNPDGGVYHVVKEGETFSEIALAYGLDWYTLSIRNNIKLSDTTPVVIMEGQTLVIEPTFTYTPTPTATKTPLPPTRTPLPTFTVDPAAAAETQSPGMDRLPAPRWDRLVDRAMTWKRPVGWILVIFSLSGLLLSLKKRK